MEGQRQLVVAEVFARGEKEASYESGSVRREGLWRVERSRQYLRRTRLRSNHAPLTRPTEADKKKMKLTLAMAGPKPLKSAEAPSLATVCRAQSMKPL